MQERDGKEQYPSIDMEKFGHRLKEACRIRNVSASDLKDFLHLGSVQAVYLWFQGKRLPNVDNLYAISRYLGIRMDDLVESREERMHAGILTNKSLTDYGKRVLVYWIGLRQDKK